MFFLYCHYRIGFDFILFSVIRFTLINIFRSADDDAQSSPPNNIILIANCRKEELIFSSAPLMDIGHFSWHVYWPCLCSCSIRFVGFSFLRLWLRSEATIDGIWATKHRRWLFIIIIHMIIIIFGWCWWWWWSMAII